MSAPVELLTSLNSTNIRNSWKKCRKNYWVFQDCMFSHSNDDSHKNSKKKKKKKKRLRTRKLQQQQQRQQQQQQQQQQAPASITTLKADITESSSPVSAKHQLLTRSSVLYSPSTCEDTTNIFNL